LRNFFAGKLFLVRFQDSCFGAIVSQALRPFNSQRYGRLVAAQHSVHWTLGILRRASRKHFSGFEFFLLPSVVHARPLAASEPLARRRVVQLPERMYL